MFFFILNFCIREICEGGTSRIEGRFRVIFFFHTEIALFFFSFIFSVFGTFAGDDQSEDHRSARVTVKKFFLD